MVVKVLNTIITGMAMRRPWRSKDKTRFTIFEFVQLICLHITSVVKDSVVFVRFLVASRDLLFAVLPGPCWNDTWVSATSHHKEQIDNWNEYHMNYDEESPYHIFIKRICFVIKETKGQNLENDQWNIHQEKAGYDITGFGAKCHQHFQVY